MNLNFDANTSHKITFYGLSKGSYDELMDFDWSQLLKECTVKVTTKKIVKPSKTNFADSLI